MQGLRKASDSLYTTFLSLVIEAEIRNNGTCITFKLCAMIPNFAWEYHYSLSIFSTMREHLLSAHIAPYTLDLDRECIH